VLKLNKFFEHRLVCLVVKIIKYAKFVRTYILYYEVLETSYIDLVLNRIVTHKNVILEIEFNFYNLSIVTNCFAFLSNF